MIFGTKGMAPVSVRLTRVLERLRLARMPRARKIVVAMIGGTVLLIGICLIVLPGPAVVVIPLGLAILATEFLWARRWLQKIRAMVVKAGDSLKR